MSQWHLQRFLTGLHPEIVHQLLLRNRPLNVANALKGAMEIEYALEFDDLGENCCKYGHGQNC